ncbi:hypothetical protein MYCTH_98107 [Thermothelomyces thermophilus ATCC 42464]|uniref:E3 ubiquitin-protein ligase listerin n=1 Tax=Thermothelomyces thermophilus (strain ATCC 42464 / BCRC 31852 / DSM 1799) TaxID=573729 RepID=G2QLH2_THET4|nr:uncharacterized protein MYCTH_98107 [Thermothelomyces thermophilus ATCC 42464]AEO60803.1 hypothetical protein MYCTH_98107 [Thermothelomyces thermophilus ATCC 42464]
MFTGSKVAHGGGFGGFRSSSTSLSYLAPPPDFTGIPHEVVVAYKNLTKKDSTTKEKALQDILGYVQTLGAEGRIELYPRLSVDDSARVRELSHQLLFHLLNLAKKRMAKKLPAFVGPWLAGAFDRDKRVLKAAADALAAFLQTKEKEEAFWKAVQGRALEFATEAIKETPDTLSDERATTKQDSDAKYYRVVGASLNLALNLMRKGDVGVLKDGLAGYLEVDALWTMSTADDAFVRRAFYQFLDTLLTIRPDILEPRLQHSATDLLKVLISLTKRFPQVWGTQKHPLQRLQQFVAQGSQGGAEEYWQSLDQLLQVLPKKTPSPEVVSTFLGFMRKGIAERLETRTSRYRAFQTYARVFEVFLHDLPLTTSLLEENLSSVSRQYLHPTSESSLPSPPRPEPLADAWMIVSRHSDDETCGAVKEEWHKLGTAFLSRMSNSLPEVSAGYQNSQTSIASEGERWFALAANVLSREGGEHTSLFSVIAETSTNVLRGALDLLTRRNFKPFGAAAVIQSAFRHCPRLCAESNLLASLYPADQAEIYGTVVASPSLPYLVSGLNTLSEGSHGQFEKVWVSLVEAALRLPDRPSTISAIRVLIGIPSVATYSQSLTGLQSFSVSAWKEYADGGSQAGLQDLCEATLSYDTLAEESLDAVVAGVISSLEAPETAGPALVALELVLKKKPELLSSKDDLHVRLVTILLALTELSEPRLSEKAKTLRQLLGAPPSGQNPVTRILEQHLSDANPSSLEVDTLVQQALSALNSGSVPADDIFPSSTVWMKELSPFLRRPPPPSLSLTSSMGGAYFLVQGDPNAKPPRPRRDSSGRSVPARMALFTAKLLSSGVALSSLPPEFQLELVFLLCLTEAIYEDQLSAAQTEGLWAQGSESEPDAREFLDLNSAAVRAVLQVCGDWKDWDMSGNSLVERLINFMLHEAVGLSAAAFYAAKSLSSLFQLLVQTHGGPPANLESWLLKLGIMKAAPNTSLATAAFLTGFGEALASSKVTANFCARLISELPGFDGVSDRFPRALPSLALLNLCMDVYETGAVPIETRKQVLALQQLTRWTGAPEELGYQAAAETCKAISRLLPGTKDTYGQYWEQAIEYCLWLWNKAAKDKHEERLSYIHASLKLMQALHAVDEPNDDLEEALASHRDAETSALIALLAANLPDELLSLLLNAPNPEDYTDEDLAQFPVAIRSYLLAWHLVFDAYSKASFRVRNDYTENLKSGKHLDPLLRFLADVLGHALGRALDLDKEGFTAEHIRSYSIDLADSEPAERDMNWLLIHLFYLILKYIPGLFKMWYLDCASKQTKNAIQSWMERFFSPLIISDALDEVVEWSSSQEAGDGDTEEIIVKVSKTSREITAGYPVDDDAATISLRVPTSYPLDPVDVVSVKRVANCSLVDGLMAFRRNISLALKGQEECAICYSIIAQDKTIPDKKCGTCNHFFHKVCLYKWFQNSGRNTCPLCRNGIDYLGSDTKRSRPEHE